MDTQQYESRQARNMVATGVIRTKQRGAAALIITLILVVIASLSSLVVNKSAIEEQKRSGIDLRNKEVYAAANGALEYGIYELMRVYNDNDPTTPDWTNTDEATEAAAANETATAAYDPYGDGSVVTLVQGIDAYNVVDAIGDPIKYTLLTAEDAQPAIIEITAPVVGVAETHVTKTVSVRVVRANLGTPSMFDGPPLIVEDCIPPLAVNGTPDITSDSVAIATISGSSAGTGCIDPGHFSVTGGGVVGEPISTDPELDLFEAMFGGITETTLKEMAAVSDNVYYVTDTNPWNTSIGSLTDPAILYFDAAADCPAFNGGVVIYGLVYFEAPGDPDTDPYGCDVQGTGAAIVYGTVAVEGDLLSMNANIELVKVDFSGTNGDDSPVSVITVLPGSWRDF
jgi:Tfp pilus assembly protein PilX